MAQIKINEISNNYSYNIGNSSYCTVALPITACWGPAFGDIAATGQTLDDALEATTWKRFTANQAGLESFIATYRGASSNYRRAKDFSYQIALTLLTQGYDILVSRLAPGAMASGSFNHYKEGDTEEPEVDGQLIVKAKYSGSFGNNILVTLKNVNQNYWNMVVYAIDASNVRTSLENIIFTLDMDQASDNILYVDEVDSKYVTLSVTGKVDDETVFVGDVDAKGNPIYDTDIVKGIRLSGGTDTFAVPTALPTGENTPKKPKRDATGDVEMDEESKVIVEENCTSIADWLLTQAAGYAISRFNTPLVSDDPYNVRYVKDLLGVGPDITTPTSDDNVAAAYKYREWLFTSATQILDLLKDKLTYNPNRIISPWDDQNFSELGVSEPLASFATVSPMHAKLMDVAYNSRCATAYLDIPKSLARSGVWNDSDVITERGYAQKLSNINSSDLYTSHSALFAPWGQYTYVGMSRQSPASPSFMALLIQRAMILNQANQYEWAMPTSRANGLKFGKLDYSVPHELLDRWQSTEGTALNIITNIPGMGTSLWGNSTLFEVPPATYQALGNLSTRLLINAIKDVVYKVGIGITYQYNNSEAYARFYAGVTPILDTMSNVGALIKGKDVVGANFDDPGYSVSMAADINGLDSVNANSVIGTIQIRVAGIINNITIDLIALPQTASLG